MTRDHGRRVAGLASVLIAVATIATPTLGRSTEQWPVPPPYTDRGIEADLIALREFDQRIGEYVALHRLLEGPLPRLQTSHDMRPVRGAMDALAQRLQAARNDAKQGDIMTPAVARLLRKRIATCLTPEEWAEILAEADESSVATARLDVNMRWPQGMPFNFVPPQLIAALPRLPQELQYRIIGRSLVLWDYHADLIVDFMPGAFSS
jgi:hypothetical protein